MQLVAGGHSEAVSEPLLLYLRGLLAWKQGKQQEGLQQLQQYMDLQLTVVEDLPYGLALFEALHAGRVKGLLRLLLSSVGGDPRQPSDPPSPLLANCIRWGVGEGGDTGSTPKQLGTAYQLAPVDNAVSSARQPCALLSSIYSQAR
jgi:hypothetical protein